MSLYISSINSGSNGNCYYVGNQHEAVLIDAGISCRETEIRMARSGLSMNKVKAVFISHEHFDHTRGAAVLSRKYQVPVYLSEGTYKDCRIKLFHNLVRHFDAYTPVEIGGLSVNAFPKQHDASEPYSFTVSGNGVNIGIITDIGMACEHVKKNFGLCHAAFLEANYDEEMLENGGYPAYLKKRISSDVGHLSNRQSLELFKACRSEAMSLLLLAHLSQDNNDPHLVTELFKRHASGTHIAVASRHRESEVYLVTAGKEDVFRSTAIKAPVNSVQMKLF